MNISHSEPEKNNAVIVIGRQFGSGGRRIGKLVAEKLGFEYFDTEILSKAAKKLGFQTEIFALHDEKKPSTLHTILQSVYGIADNFHNVSICGEKIYAEQSKVIKEICKDKSCVIVGRTADYILKDHPMRISVFLHSPLQKRIEAVINRGEASTPEEAMEIAKKLDKNRENYYNYFTGTQNWGKAFNYDLTLDSSQLEATVVAQIIADYALSRIERKSNGN